MDIPNVGKSGGVERSGDRHQRAESKRDDAAAVLIPRDEASISSSSRARAASVEVLANRARYSGEERAVQIAAAIERLKSGALDGAAVGQATAQKLLGADFLSD